MLSALRQRFGTLQWKLTGAFVLVSLLLALTLAAVMLGLLLWLFSSDLLLDEFWSGSRAIAIAIVPEYRAPDRTPDTLGAQLQLWMAQNDVARTPAPGEVGEGADLSSGLYWIALLDTEGRIITSTAPLDMPNGRLLTEVERAETHPLIGAALAGSEDRRALTIWLEPDHEAVAVAPITDGGQLLGAVYTRFKGIPSPQRLVSETAPYVGLLLLPWLVLSGALGLLYAWAAGRGIVQRVQRLAGASAAMASGDLSHRVSDPSSDEIGQLGRQFNAMAEQLEEHVRALRLLAERNAQLAEQAGALATVEERNRLARELHDSVSQELFSLTMLAGAARRTLERSPDLAAEQLAEIQESAQRALHETRGMIFALRPAALGEHGLAPALRELAAAVEERQGVRLDLRVSGERRLPLEHEQALFRIVQEALANVVRHSGAREASVALEYGQDVRLTVRDAGRGFDPSARHGGSSVGLASMAERAQALGGRLTIESAPGAGTAVVAVLPAAEH